MTPTKGTEKPFVGVISLSQFKANSITNILISDHQTSGEQVKFKLISTILHCEKVFFPGAPER